MASACLVCCRAPNTSRITLRQLLGFSRVQGLEGVRMAGLRAFQRLQGCIRKIRSAAGLEDTELGRETWCMRCGRNCIQVSS